MPLKHIWWGGLYRRQACFTKKKNLLCNCEKEQLQSRKIPLKWSSEIICKNTNYSCCSAVSRDPAGMRETKVGEGGGDKRGQKHLRNVRRSTSIQHRHGQCQTLHSAVNLSHSALAPEFDFEHTELQREAVRVKKGILVRILHLMIFL